MSQHSVADARNHLSDLIARAEKGETVVITRHGAPVVEMTAVRASPRRMTEADIAGLDVKRVKRRNSETDAATLVRDLREEDFERLLRR